MLAGIFFLTTRFLQLFFLIPIVGMLGYLVHVYVENNELTPSPVLVLFIVSALAMVWVFATMLFYAIAKHNGYLIAFVDLGLFAAFIAGLVVARGIAGESCSNFNINSSLYAQSGIFVYNISKFCNLLKASWALSIIEVLLFFNSIWLALWVHHHHRKDDQDNYRSTTEKRRSRRSGGSRRRSGGSQASRSRGGYDDGGSQRSGAPRSNSGRRNGGAHV